MLNTSSLHDDFPWCLLRLPDEASWRDGGGPGRFQLHGGDVYVMYFVAYLVTLPAMGIT